MTSVNPNDPNLIQNYANQIFDKLDEKDGKDGAISKSIWNQFIGADVDGVQVGNGEKSQINFLITKDKAIKSIISYLKKIGLSQKEKIDNIVDNIKSSQAQSKNEKQGSSSNTTDVPPSYGIDAKLRELALRDKNIIETMEKKHPEIVNDMKEYIKAKTVLCNVRQALGIAAFLDPETNQVKLDLDNPEDCEKVKQYYDNVIKKYRSMGHNDIANRYMEALKQFESALNTISAIKQKYADDKEPSFDEYVKAKNYVIIPHDIE